MENKNFAPLGNFIEQIRGVSYKPTDVYDIKNSNCKAILRANNIQNNHVNFDDLVFVDKSKISQDQYLKQGDILVCASSGSKNLVGKACLIKKDLDMAFGAFCKVIRTKKLEPRFLGHYFNSDVYRITISNQAIGANINNIRKEHIDNLLIPVYTRETQREMADKLDKIINMIENQEEMIKKCDDLIKSQFIEMFGDPDLSQQKESWDELENVGEIVGGSTPKTSIKEYWDGDLNWFTPAEIKENDFIVNQSERKITELGAKSCSLRKMPINTVILSSRAPIGKVALADCEFYCNQGFKNIVCNENLNPIFLLMLLKYNNEYLNSLGRGATFKEISKTIVSKIKIPTPPIELQNQFADFVKHIDKLKFTLKQTLEKLENCYHSLMQEYFE